jgi:hypothetical protein
MTTYVLFGVKAKTLDEARDQVERRLGVALMESEGLYSGGIHFTLGFPSEILDLKNNLDLDDVELEFGGLSEPDFPRYPYLLYLNDTEKNSDTLRALESAPAVFEKLRTKKSRNPPDPRWAEPADTGTVRRCMSLYVLFGVKTIDLDEAREHVESTLGVALDARTSLNRCGDYYSLGFPRRSLVLRNNIDSDDGVLAELDPRDKPEEDDLGCKCQ